MNVNNNSWFPLIIVSLALFIITLDTTFMNVSISQIIIDLNTNLSNIQMITCFYTVTMASLMLVSSKLQEIIGKRKIFIIGAIIYGTGALIASLSQNDVMLFIGWSLLEGIGGALMTPAVIAIISETYSEDKRTFALAINSAIVGIAAAIGPLFGGIVTTFISWRFGFVLELIIVVFILLTKNKIANFPSTSSFKELDIIGCILIILGLVNLILGILTLKKDIHLSIILITIGCIIIIIFGIFEKIRDKQGKIPLLYISLLKNRNLRNGTIIRLLTTMITGGSLFTISIFLQSVLKFNALHTGLTLLSGTAGLLLCSMIAPKLAIKLNHKTMMIIGFIIAIIGAIILRSQFYLDMNYTYLLLGLFIFDAGIGFVISLGVDISLNNVPKEKDSVASGFISTGQSLGNSMGIAIMGCILIIGAIGGIHDAISTYNPEYITDENLHLSAHETIEKVEHSNILNEKIVNIVVHDAMKMVMSAIIIILFMGLLLTTTLKNKK